MPIICCVPTTVPLLATLPIALINSRDSYSNVSHACSQASCPVKVPCQQDTRYKKRATKMLTFETGLGVKFNNLDPTSM